MEPQRVRRRRRRRSSRAQREVVAWLTLILTAIKGIYHWAMLLALIIFILMVGFAFPAFA